MKIITQKKFKEGAASFYIVAFSTLILVIVAMSFAAAVISEIERTANDDLAQSAYDSALAGVEDAKLAFYSYQNCVSGGGSSVVGNVSCEKIKEIMERPNCQMVGQILGRTFEAIDGQDVVRVKEGNENNMQQAYTCAKIQTTTLDYQSTLTAEEQTRTILAKFDGVSAKDVDKVKISWYSGNDQEQNNAESDFVYNNFSEGAVEFPSLVDSKAAVPPTISLEMTQTGNNFTFEDFYVTKDDRTNRGLIYLVPTETQTTSGTNSNFRSSIWDEGEKVNTIGSEAFLKSNEKTVANLPYTVKCPEGGSSEFACSALITLPDPVGGERNDNTFLFTVSIPYGKPKTSFALEFFCKSGIQCGKKIINDDGSEEIQNEGQAYLDKVQIVVDSTGRANDLYRRVETRMDYLPNSSAGGSSLAIKGPLELFGNSGGGGVGTALDKSMTVTCEYNFGPPTC